MSAIATAAEQPSRIFAFTNHRKIAQLHLYADVAAMLAQRPLQGAQFYDTRGQILVPVFGPGWQMTGLRAADVRRSETAVRNRLLRIVAVRRLAAEREVAMGMAAAPNEGRNYAPILDDQPLDQCYKLLAERGFEHPLPSPNGPPDIRDPWHNFWCHGL